MNGDLFAPPDSDLRNSESTPGGPIAHIYKLSNGNVVCFDSKAQELKQYAGSWEEMKALINANVAPNVRVHE